MYAFMQGYVFPKEALKTEPMVRPAVPPAPAAGPGAAVPGMGAGQSWLGGYLANRLKPKLRSLGQPSMPAQNFGAHPDVMRLKGQQQIRNMPAADKAQIANQAGKAFNPQPAK